MEVWLQIPDYPNYDVSSEGQVRNRITGRVLKQANVKGYRRVVLCDEDGHHPKAVHRLVADTFYDGDHEGLEVNHIDGRKANNFLGNLEWCTSSENRRHAFRTGLQKASHSKQIMIIETGEVFDSISDCARYIRGDFRNISACLRGKQKSHRGYHFEYVV